MNVTIPVEKVTAMLEHLYNVPLPYRYSVPVIRALEEAMAESGAENPPSNSDHV